MKLSTAQTISENLEQSIRSMSAAIAVVMAELPESEAEKYKKAIALPLGNISLVLDTIYDEYPDLAPPGLR